MLATSVPACSSFTTAGEPRCGDFVCNIPNEHGFLLLRSVRMIIQGFNAIFIEIIGKL